MPIYSWGHEDHWHARGELLALVAGHARVRIDGGTDAALSPQRALWIPAGVVHSARMSEDAVVLPVISHTEASERGLPESSTLVPMTAGLRRAVHRQIRAHMFRSDSDHLDEVLDEARAALRSDLHVPMPSSPAARYVAVRLTTDPAAHVSLADWAERTYVSQATLRRAFVGETGMPFSQWLTHVRLAASLPLLRQGLPVKRVAVRVGYASTAGYIGAFSKQFGHTPGAHAPAEIHGASTRK